MRWPQIATLAAAASIVAAEPAAAERLIASLSNRHVMITSNYTGVELVLFGSVERDAASAARTNPYDIVATVIGPRETLRVRHSQRVLGIWVNVDSREFENVPSYLAVLSNRPLDAITNSETLRRLQIGLNDTQLLQRASVTIADSGRGDPFRRALLRLKGRPGLYREDMNGVTFLTSALFRASIPLPAEVLVGTYEVDVKLFADGTMIARAPSALEVYKAGFEQTVSAAARDHGLAYGLTTSAMALLTGWLASIVFRRD